MASLFANARRAKSIVLSSRTTAPATTAATEGLRDRHYSDSHADDAHQVRDDEDHVGQSSDAEAGEQSRAAVVQSFKADVASLFAQARTRKSVASSAKDIAAERTSASEVVHCRLEQIHEYDPEVSVGVKSKDLR